MCTHSTSQRGREGTVGWGGSGVRCGGQSVGSSQSLTPLLALEGQSRGPRAAPPGHTLHDPLPSWPLPVGSSHAAQLPVETAASTAIGTCQLPAPHFHPGVEPTSASCLCCFPTDLSSFLITKALPSKADILALCCMLSCFLFLAGLSLSPWAPSLVIADHSRHSGVKFGRVSGCVH